MLPALMHKTCQREVYKLHISKTPFLHHPEMFIFRQIFPSAPLCLRHFVILRGPFHPKKNR